jgi:hypothetical protein
MAVERQRESRLRDIVADAIAILKLGAEVVVGGGRWVAYIAVEYLEERN